MNTTIDKKFTEYQSLNLSYKLSLQKTIELVATLKKGTLLVLSPLSSHEKAIAAARALPFGCTISIPAGLNSITAAQIARVLPQGRGIQLDLFISPVKAAKMVILLKTGCWVSTKQHTPFNMYLAIAQALCPGTGLVLPGTLLLEEILRIARKLKVGSDLLMANNTSEVNIKNLTGLLPEGIHLHLEDSYVDDLLTRLFVNLVENIGGALPIGTWIDPGEGVPVKILISAARSTLPGNGFILPATIDPQKARLIAKALHGGCYLSFNKDISIESAISAVRVLPNHCELFFNKDTPATILDRVTAIATSKRIPCTLVKPEEVSVLSQSTAEQSPVNVLPGLHGFFSDSSQQFQVHYANEEEVEALTL